MPRLKATRETGSVSCGCLACWRSTPRSRRPRRRRGPRFAMVTPEVKTLAGQRTGDRGDQRARLQHADRHAGFGHRDQGDRRHHRPRRSSSRATRPGGSRIMTNRRRDRRCLEPAVGVGAVAVGRGRSPQDRSRKIPALGARRAAQICPMAASQIPIATASPSERLATWHSALPTPIRSNPRDYVPSRAHGRRYRPGRHHTDEL